MANSQKGKIDMTTGHIMRNIILFAIPIIIGNVLQQLYTTVDALVIGKYCGDTSLAAVGTSSQPVEVLLCVFLGIGTGVSILISQYMVTVKWGLANSDNWITAYLMSKLNPYNLKRLIHTFGVRNIIICRRSFGFCSAKSFFCSGSCFILKS